MILESESKESLDRSVQRCMAKTLREECQKLKSLYNEMQKKLREVEK